MVTIASFEPQHRTAVFDLSMRAWAPVFPQVRRAVPTFVYDSFYPAGWRERQHADIAAVLDGEPENINIALEDTTPVGWVCTRLHPEDSMGEVYILAVDPDSQRAGVGRSLLDHSIHRVREAGMRMVMVETGDDPGHERARSAYESAGFQRWPVARYFKDLSS